MPQSHLYALILPQSLGLVPRRVVVPAKRILSQLTAGFVERSEAHHSLSAGLAAPDPPFVLYGCQRIGAGVTVGPA
jgi:hypothetical protein